MGYLASKRIKGAGVFCARLLAGGVRIALFPNSAQMGDTGRRGRRPLRRTKDTGHRGCRPLQTGAVAPTTGVADGRTAGGLPSAPTKVKSRGTPSVGVADSSLGEGA